MTPWNTLFRLVTLASFIVVTAAAGDAHATPVTFHLAGTFPNGKSLQIAYTFDPAIARA